MSTFPRRIALLGSTGSIGRQTLDVARCFPEHFQIVALAAHRNMTLLAEQAAEFSPSLVACVDPPLGKEQGAGVFLAARNDSGSPAFVTGAEGLLAAATHPDADIVVAATSGLMGIEPVLAAIQAGKTIALANKEALVMAGHLIMHAAAQAGVQILPVDSEHSALWQLLRGEPAPEVRRLLITASGGPFRQVPLSVLKTVSVDQALAHPTWRMGPKVTIDSATLMNKGLEVMEAHWLFDMPYERLDVVVQPESIIHSMVEFIDGSLQLQASLPSMHLPILDALSYPLRLDTAGRDVIHTLDWTQVACLHFAAVDETRFPCYRLARSVARLGGTYPCALVGADEEAVALFLEGKIGFLEIAELIEAVLERHQSLAMPDLPAILHTRDEAHIMARELHQSGRVRS